VKSNPDDTSLEASSHNPEAFASQMGSGTVPGELNLIVNGVHMSDAMEKPPVTISIMTPNDVINPEASIHYLTDDESGDVKAYLSTEGYKVATTPEELLALLKA